MFGIKKLENKIEFLNESQSNLLNTLFGALICLGITPKKLIKSLNDMNAIKKFEGELTDLMFQELMKAGIDIDKKVSEINKSIGRE